MRWPMRELVTATVAAAPRGPTLGYSGPGKGCQPEDGCVSGQGATPPETKIP
jgi:hypothetical protein